MSSISALLNAPRSSASVASKAYLEVWTASELQDQRITFETVSMLLVRVPMTSPTNVYENMSLPSLDVAVDMVVKS